MRPPSQEHFSFLFMLRTALYHFAVLIKRLFPFLFSFFEKAALNSFEMKKLECTFDEMYFIRNESECAMKVEDGRNKFAGGHSELIKAIDDDDIVVGTQFYEHFIVYMPTLQTIAR